MRWVQVTSGSKHDGCWTHWSLKRCLSCLLNVQALDRDACAFKQACEDDRSREGSQVVAQGSKSFPQRSDSWWKTLEGRSCDSRTKSSLGLNCTTWRSYIHGGLVLGITLLVPPTTTVLLHLPPTIGVALVASESVDNHMREASIRGPHLSHSTSHDESEGSQNGRPHFVSYPDPYSKSPSPETYQTCA